MRLIDADAFIDWCKEIVSVDWNKRVAPTSWADAYEDVISELECAPTIEAEPVRHGHWISLEPEIGLFACSECEYKILRTECNYCPNCGAKMDGDKNDE